MATHEEAAYILQLQETNQQLREKLRVAEEIIFGTDNKYGMQDCLDHYYVGVFDKDLAKIREVK